jgi:mannose-1-phosphate guanylyltransferase
MGWSDIGSWDALMAARPADGEGNRVSGRADMIGCRNVMVDSDGPRVSVVGLEDVIVVVDRDEVLVTSRAGAQQVGKLPGATQQ